MEKNLMAVANEHPFVLRAAAIALPVNLKICNYGFYTFSRTYNKLAVVANGY